MADVLKSIENEIKSTADLAMRHGFIIGMHDAGITMIRRAQQSLASGALTAYLAERKGAIALFDKARSTAIQYSVEYEYPQSIIDDISKHVVDDKLSTNK